MVSVEKTKNQKFFEEEPLQAHLLVTIVFTNYLIGSDWLIERGIKKTTFLILLESKLTLALIVFIVIAKVFVLKLKPIQFSYLLYETISKVLISI